MISEDCGISEKNRLAARRHYRSITNGIQGPLSADVVQRDNVPIIEFESCYQVFDRARHHDFTGGRRVCHGATGADRHTAHRISLTLAFPDMQADLARQVTFPAVIAYRQRAANGPAGAGGNLFCNPQGRNSTVVSSSITQHPELGLGEWSDDEIKRTIATGVGRNGRQLLTLMGFSFYARISDEDLDAVVAYLRTIPPSTAAPLPAE